MAAAGRRRLEALSFSRNLFRIVSLLFLVHVGLSLDFENNLQYTLIDAVQTARESVRLMRKTESGTEHILTLLDIVNSMANKKQLKLFQQFLQDAVDEAYKQKVQKTAEAKVSTLQFNKDMLGYLPNIQELKSKDPLTRRMAETKEQIVQILSQYILLRKDLYTEKANETKLENALKNLNSHLEDS